MQERRLSDPGFAVDEHEAPGFSPRGVERLREKVKLGIAFQELGGHAHVRNAHRIMFVQFGLRFKRR